FVGESASVRETMSETKGLLASGMALGAGIGGAFKALGKATKASGKAIKTAGVGLTRGKAGLQKLEAKRDLKNKLKSGELSKAGYAKEMQSLNMRSEDQRMAIANDKMESKAERAMIRKELASGNSAYKKSDLRASDNKLIKQENQTLKEMEKLAAQEGGVNSEKYKELAQRHEALGSLIDARTQRSSRKELNINDQKSRLMAQNSKRGVASKNIVSAAELEKQKLIKERELNKDNKLISSFIDGRIKSADAREAANKKRAKSIVKSKENIKKG
ncbi:hypothetical protein, partial [Mycoplasma sp. HS2188]|uniref:hypothetical protein n=1 Tax=Mycoplasma sp. HS2188 TaxID=2976765 RepID=UPI0021AA3DEE